jgi:hypothetical protein
MCSNDEKYFEFVIMFREWTHGLTFILYAKKIINASRPEQPYTEALVGSQVTQKKTNISWNLKLRDPVHKSPTPQDTIQSPINPFIHNIYLKIHHNAPIYSQVSQVLSPHQAFQAQCVGIFYLICTLHSLPWSS